MTKLPWFEALKFSLRVMRKSFFKLFIPSMALSYVMGGLLALIAGNAEFNLTHAPLSINLLIVILICILALPIYAFLYPLLKRYVLFRGMQELCPHVLMDYKKSLGKIDYSPLLDFIPISFVRFLFQSLSFLLFVLPFPLLLFLSFNIVFAVGIAILFSIIALWPVAWSFSAYFFAELHAIDRLIQEAKILSVHPVSIFWSHEIDETTQEENPDFQKSKKIIRPDKKLFWPILSWKALLLAVYMALVFALGILYTRSGMATQSIMDYTNNLLFAILLPAYLFGFLLLPFFEPLLNAIFKLRIYPDRIFGSYHIGIDIFLENPIALWTLLFFLLLFGLMTAFFFLVETLSSVYFYHRGRGNSGKKLTEKAKLSKETVCRKPAKRDKSF
jgi:hypothetical protein